MRAIIVDDEKPARDRLARMIVKNSEIEIVGNAENGIDALTLIESKKPDVVFLDIEMPEMDGFGVARSILEMSFAPPAIVFVTAFSEFAIKAFEVSAIDYLVKPVNETRFLATIARLNQNGRQRKSILSLIENIHSDKKDEKFALKIGAKYVVCDPAKISAIKASDHYSIILVGGQELLSDEPLDSLLKKINNQKFVRIHRSGIINLDFLKELERVGDRKYVAILSDQNNTKIAISRDKLDQIKSKLKT
jgi:two-component system LytT family response regulator